jgi:hypothetical protein
VDAQIINLIASTTQQTRRLLEREFSEQFEGLYDLRPFGPIPPEGGVHLDAKGRLMRAKLYAIVQHKLAQGMPQDQAVLNALREAAFTTLNRFAALKMLEARGLMQECVSRGDQSAGFREFCGLAPSLPLLQDAYATYLGCIFDELAVEVKVLFDRQDPSGLLWPRRPALVELVALLNAPELAQVWGEDETIGWIYQYFNSLDERRQMRAESAAPRNSRELAVRNQFFTPRYIVKFLVDYTLGELAEKEPKDPRDLKVLDPACGSGHFLLYAFEVLEGIYRNAWERADLPASILTGRTLKADYPDWDALQREIPSLILAHNVHGVDIDPRCAQIAALSLWMRAQKAFQAMGLLAADRPRIRQVRVAVAEPMPGERDYLRAFLEASFSQDPEARVLGELIQVSFDAMGLAGELGSLLRVEDTIRTAIHQARSAASGDIQQFRHLSLFAPAQQSVQLTLDLKQLTDESFWEAAEGRIYSELSAFAEQAAQDQGFQRQLFAEDAAHGFAFIDILGQTYDVVLMNPPFGECSIGAKAEFQRLYPRTKNDLYAAFVERGLQLLRRGGRLGAITSRTGFFLTSYRRWREEILLGEARPLIVADLGQGVLDAMVETAAYTLEKIG